jgi:hypothetical protein
MALFVGAVMAAESLFRLAENLLSFGEIGLLLGKKPTY